jgi:hypothetical protein
MPDRKSTPLRRILAPATTLKLVLRDGTEKRFKLCFDFNVGSAILEKTDLSLTNSREFWSQVGKADPAALRATFWAAASVYQPEYANDEGLETIGSLITEDNAPAIIEALWSAYLLYVGPVRRAELEAARKEIEARNAAEEAGEDETPLVETKTEKSKAARASSSSTHSPALIWESDTKNSES